MWARRLIRDLYFYWLVLLVISCAAPSAFERMADAGPVLLSGENGIESSAAFNKLLAMTAGTSAYESARIDYLYERLKATPYQFLRNGAAYSGSRAVMHLRWKHRRQGGKIDTAEGFVKNVARGSHMSGELYYLQNEQREVYPLHVVLSNELDALGQHLNKRQRESEG